MYWFDDFDPFDGHVPNEPIFDAPFIASQARELLDGCTLEDVRLLEYAIDDAVEAMQEFCLMKSLDDLAEEIFKNRCDEISGVLSDSESATLIEVRKTLDRRQGTREYPLLPEIDDVSETDALYMAVICGRLDGDAVKSFALLTLSFLASYVDAVRSSDSEWEHVDMPADIARLSSAANDAVYAAMALRRATEFSALTESHKDMQEEEARRREQLAISGFLGAKAKHAKSALLKDWALQQAKDMRGSDVDIASKLAAKIPMDLAGISRKPERFIYDTLRKKQT